MIVNEEHLGLGSAPPVDRWLRFAPAIQARYEEQHVARRINELRSAILVGLLFYNVYNVTSLILLADIVSLSVALRVGLVTPVSLGLAWLIGRSSPRWTERMILFGILNAYLVPVFLFWMTKERLGLFTFGELFVSIAFANMLLSLRFPHAMVFTAVAFAASFLAVLTKPGLEEPLRFAFSVQIATVCVFGVYANYRNEKRRCLEYLATLGATLEAQQADQARRVFQDLSQTDVLTGLPNRRYLSERLDEWCEVSGTMALLMIDIDHFKLYNDTLGHPAGDECLRCVANLFADIVRQDDVFCARFGGEEFIVLLRNTSEMEAARWARNLVRSVGALGIFHPARSDGISNVTISIGVATRPDGSQMSAMDLVAAADRGLYVAKNQGRNGYAFGKEPFELAQTG